VETRQCLNQTLVAAEEDKEDKEERRVREGEAKAKDKEYLDFLKNTRNKYLPSLASFPIPFIKPFFCWF
jgi:hypothetical protein